ncbi:ribonuclease activity regulator RraA [Acuticoccus sp. MNP-M23]|uniref:RraA family protein n=1 Tax=Acuticoccus sp. MNP-M23 TaxID=3072793 RepID=UPI0028150665|nr:ribonuclease activity regulator RraA [Acuticoccus sp. MNP-M23]WMS41970.1 ribonuclease activity regulator RraA [Acuticoccus sp. MNP-M23]
MPIPANDVLTGEPLAALGPGTLEALRKVGVAGIASELFKRGLRDTVMQGVAPLQGNVRPFAGPAYTVRTIPMRPDIGTADFMMRLPRNLQRIAVTEVAAGEVLCVDARGERRAGFMGDILALSLAVRGVGAVVTDGGLRDVAGIGDTGLPAYCAGASPAGSQAHLHVVAVNESIACGGLPVFPGDVLVGDADGVVVVPRALADDVAGTGASQADLEAFCRERIRKGAPLIGTYPPNDATLEAFHAQRRGGTPST